MKKPSVCVDLDGVLADYSGGWKGLENIGEPIQDMRHPETGLPMGMTAVEFTHKLAKFAKVIIYTARCKVFPPGVPGPDGVPEPNRSDAETLAGYVKVWLDRHGFAYDEVYIGQGKPFAVAYVDDRAVVCRPQSPFVADLSPLDPGPFELALMAVQNLCNDGHWNAVGNAIKESEK